jgi:hypothetical protein
MGTLILLCTAVYDKGLYITHKSFLSLDKRMLPQLNWLVDISVLGNFLWYVTMSQRPINLIIHHIIL